MLFECYSYKQLLGCLDIIDIKLLQLQSDNSFGELLSYKHKLLNVIFPSYSAVNMIERKVVDS